MADATSQPTGAVVINTANAITTGLVIAEYPPVSGRASVSTPFGTAYDGADPPAVAGFGTIGPTEAATSGITMLAVGYRSSNSDGGSRKYLARIRDTSNINAEGLVLGLNDFTNNRSPRCVARFFDDTVVVIGPGDSYLPAVDNTQVIMGVTYTRNNAAGLRFFVNGSTAFTAATPDKALFPVESSLFASDQFGGGNNVAMPATMVAYWNRTLSDAEMADLMANPWQIFEDAVADTTGPDLSLPTLNATSPSTLTGQITSNEAGTRWSVLTPAAQLAPTRTQIRAGQDALGASAVSSLLNQAMTVGVNTLLFTGATAGQAYKQHTDSQDTAITPNVSNIVSSASETTPVPPQKATVTLYQADGTTPAASITGLQWAWWDDATPDLSLAADISGTGASTDASGVFDVTLTGTVLTLGQTGTLLIYKTDGTAESTATLAFCGPLATVN